MAKKAVFVNKNHGSPSRKLNIKLSAKDRRRIKRWEKQIEYARENELTQGFNAINDSVEACTVQTQIERKAYIPHSISSARPLKGIANKAAISIKEYRSKIEQASKNYEALFNRAQQEVPYKDAMSLVVNHAHQRSPKKKWS